METMISLMRKAGWDGRREDWQKVSNMRLVRYKGFKVAVSYSTWRVWRDWVEEQSGVEES